MEGERLSVAKAEEAGRCVAAFFRVIYLEVRTIELAAGITGAWVQAGMPRIQWWSENSHSAVTSEDHKS